MNARVTDGPGGFRLGTFSLPNYDHSNEHRVPGENVARRRSSYLYHPLLLAILDPFYVNRFEQELY